RGRRIADGVDREPLAAQQVGGGLGEDGLVVGEEDASHRTHAWCSPGSGSSKGRVTTKRAPPSRASSTVIAPPAAGTLRATTARPSPMPLFSALVPLVVKNGSKIRSRSGGGTPGPWSRTSRTRPLPLAWAARRTVPPAGEASIAFCTRL